MNPNRRQWIAGMGALGLAAVASASMPALALQSSKKRENRRRPDARAVAAHVDVAIIGAGALGAWTAWHLVRRGQSVRIFDAYGAGNGRAASNAPTMFLDPMQGGDALYAALAAPSLENWRDLSSSASLPITTSCAVLTGLTSQDASQMAADPRLQAGAALRSRYPQMLWQLSLIHI